MGRPSRGTLKPLLEETPEAYYWMGFLLADGHFSEKRLAVCLAKHDEEHLIKLSQFLANSNGLFPAVNTYDKGTNSRLGVWDIDNMKLLKQRWGIVNNKTISPPDISWVSSDNLIPVLIGFIDGDGCIQKQSKRTNSKISIKNHISWVSFLQQLSDNIHQRFDAVSPKAHINNSGYVILNICRYSIVNQLKLYSNSLPVMSRKWDIIDEFSS
jgi:hypothetical protein